MADGALSRFLSTGALAAEYNSIAEETTFGDAEIPRTGM